MKPSRQGYLVVEFVVGFAIFAIASTAFLSSVVRLTRIQVKTSERAAAVGLIGNALERVRALPPGERTAVTVNRLLDAEEQHQSEARSDHRLDARCVKTAQGLVIHVFTVDAAPDAGPADAVYSLIPKTGGDL